MNTSRQCVKVDTRGMSDGVASANWLQPRAFKPSSSSFIHHSSPACRVKAYRKGAEESVFHSGSTPAIPNAWPRLHIM
eukprot:1148169-Pelagomonas_calceolata.AAC.3